MEVPSVAVLLVWMIGSLPCVAADVQDHSNKAGIHCGEVTLPLQQEQLDHLSVEEDDHYHCVHCMFPQNCLENNTCRPGTVGSTCEQCQQHSMKQHRYHRVGSTCTPCPDVPWAAVGFGVYCLLLIFMSFSMGFTESVCTKMKLLCHFLQHLQLSLHIKVAWPDNLVQFVSNTAFTSFNTNILNPECLLPSWPVMSEHYLEWATSLGIPMVVIILGYFLDKSMKKFGKQRSPDDPTHQKVPRRTTVRSLVFFVVMVMYMPVSVACIRTYLCSNTVPAELVLDHSKDIFLLNNNVRCETFTFQTLHFVASVYLVFMVVLLPLIIVFFTLRQRKWDLLYKHWALYCPVYEAYKDRFCFWESVPLLRKFVAAVITEAYPFTPKIQVLVQLGMSAVYMVLIVILRPYRPAYWGHPVLNVHTIFEVVGNVVICLVQALALSMVVGQYKPVYSKGAIALVSVVLVVWLVTVLAMSCETRQGVSLDKVMPFVQEAEEGPQKSTKPRFNFLKKTGKVDPISKFEETVNKNKQQIDF